MTINKKMTLQVPIKSDKWELSYTGWNYDTIDQKLKITPESLVLKQRVWVAGLPKTKNSTIMEIHNEYVKVYTEGSGMSNLYLDQIIIHPLEFVKRRKPKKEEPAKKRKYQKKVKK